MLGLVEGTSRDSNWYWTVRFSLTEEKQDGLETVDFGAAEDPQPERGGRFHRAHIIS